jgi:hypothetical protein
LYSAVKRRRFAFSLTSVSGLDAGNDITFAMVHATLALLGSNSNLGGGDLLTHVGTEGALRAAESVNESETPDG